MDGCVRENRGKTLGERRVLFGALTEESTGAAGRSISAREGGEGGGRYKPESLYQGAQNVSNKAHGPSRAAFPDAFN